jgi:hypothetical protein
LTRTVGRVLVTSVAPEDTDQAVTVLCDAFRDYSAMRYVLGSADDYERRLAPARVDGALRHTSTTPHSASGPRPNPSGFKRRPPPPLPLRSAVGDGPVPLATPPPAD